MEDKLLHRNNSSLTGEDIDRLFVLWQQSRDERARERLVDHFLPLAYSLARRYHGAREPIGDLRQVAAVGLLKAINNYDTGRANGFAPYAVPSILGELRRYFRDCGWAVHLPRSIQDLALKVEKARRELSTTHAAVTAPMIAEYLELTVEEVLEAMEANSAHHAVSYDAPTSDDPDAPSIEASTGTIEPGYSLVEISTLIQQASHVLSERERFVLDRRFNADRTQVQIAEELGVSQMQISRILRGALESLAAEMNAEPEASAEQILD